jgi:SHS2 domain-containing protein
MTYYSLPHTADIRMGFEAATFGALLQEALVVMRQLLAGDSAVEPRECRPFAIPHGRPADLFLGFMRELLFLSATEGFLPARIDLIDDGAPGIHGTLTGERIHPDRHEPQPEVKAITRHGLVVERRGDGWYAEVVFDV